MGKLTIEGVATKEYEYDVMEITVRFQVHEKTSAAAIRKVTRQCEECLSIFEEQGISMSNIRIGEDSVEQEYEEHALDVCATREVVMRLPFDVSFSNYFMEMIEKKGYEVELDINPLMSNNSEIRNDLLKLAIEDSKSKASFIASAMNQKIIGIDSVEIGASYGSSKMDWMCCEQERGYFVAPKILRLSNKLMAPTTTESATVEVVWIIE